MCGIGEIIYKTGGPPDDAAVRSLSDAIIHRGPDGARELREDNLALVHRRLVNIDIPEVANQPMHLGSDLTIVYNGDIYNYIELRQDLVSLGHAFRTESDTEVMLDGQGGDETMIGYERYCPTCLRPFPWRSRPGMFREIVSKSKLLSIRLAVYAAYFNFPSLRRRRLLARNKFIRRDVSDCGHWSMLKQSAKSCLFEIA